MTASQAPPRPPAAQPPAAARRTRRLLGWGAAAGPLYLAVAAAQALTREGFDLSRHAVSLLSNGPLGWIQVLNFLVAGGLVLLAAAGLRRALTNGPGRRWLPRLVAVYGAGILASGVFAADPADGFPPGTAPGPPATLTWHGALHLVAGAVAFLALVAACLLVAHRCARRDRRGWAGLSFVTGVGFLAAWVALVATGAAHPAVNIAFAVAVAAGWLWLSAMLASLYVAGTTRE